MKTKTTRTGAHSKRKSLNLKSKTSYWRYIMKKLIDANFHEDHPQAWQALVKATQADIYPVHVEIGIVSTPSIKFQESEPTPAFRKEKSYPAQTPKMQVNGYGEIHN